MRFAATQRVEKTVVKPSPENWRWTEVHPVVRMICHCPGAFVSLFTERTVLIFLFSQKEYWAPVLVEQLLHVNSHWSLTQKASYKREIIYQQTKMLSLLLYWFSESFRLADGVWLTGCPTFCSPWWGIVTVTCHLWDLLNPIITAEEHHRTGMHSNKVFVFPPKH